MIRIMSPRPQRAEQLYDAAAKVFAGVGYFNYLRFCRQAYFAASTYDWNVSRVAEVDGQIVSHVGVWEYRMRVGGARLRTGGIGAVMTIDDYRRRGLSSRCMRSMLKAMRDAGYDYTVLFGRRDFYDRFGYVQAWPEAAYTVELADLPDTKLRLSLRKVSLAEALCERGAVMRIYNRENATRTGSAERPIYYSAGSGLWHDYKCTTLNDSAGRVRGYLVTHIAGESLEVEEAGGLGAGCGVGQLLAGVRRLAIRSRCRRVCTHHIAHDHPLCCALREGTCRAELRYIRSGGPMAAVVNLRQCLEALGGELSDRLGRSAMKNFRGAVTIAGTGEQATLKIANGQVRVAPRVMATPNRIVAGHSAARLIIGSEPPAVLAEQSAVKFRGAGLGLAEALFPHQWPMLSAIDHY